jgi:hypothetical protein
MSCLVRTSAAIGERCEQTAAQVQARGTPWYRAHLALLTLAREQGRRLHVPTVSGLLTQLETHQVMTRAGELDGLLAALRWLLGEDVQL